MSNSKTTISELLSHADIVLNGSRPFDIKVHNEAFYDRILKGGTLALGESYMDGWWDAPRLDQFFQKVIAADIAKHIHFNLPMLLTIIRAIIFNMQNKSRAFMVGEEHYDTGNDLYEKMLDKRLVYTCGYWKDAKNLDEAQEAKLDLVCRKIGLKKGDRVLDIGCGWGSFLKFASEKYGVTGVGLTVSKEQAELAQKLCVGLPIEIRLQDYRDTNEKFDHIVSLGMFEHVGYKNYLAYMEMAHRCLKDGGLFLLHTIGNPTTVFSPDPWIDKYIFPNGALPSIAQIGKSIEKFFIMEDWHNFGADYDKTLMEWFTNFDRAWPELEEKYGKRFYAMWKYYLLSCAGAFRTRRLGLWQIVLSKKGVPGGYASVR